MATYVEFYRPGNEHRPRVIGYAQHSEAVRFVEHKRSLGFIARILEPKEIKK